MTKPQNGIPRNQLLRLLEIQGTLLQRAELTADILRWKLIDHGYPLDQIDHVPEINHPETGKRPPRPRVTIGIKNDGFTPPELLSVVPVAEMDDEAFRKHCCYRHPGERDMTPGTHEWLHTIRKANHVHAIREGNANGSGTNGNGNGTGKRAGIQRNGSGDKKTASKSAP